MSLDLAGKPRIVQSDSRNEHWELCSMEDFPKSFEKFCSENSRTLKIVEARTSPRRYERGLSIF